MKRFYKLVSHKKETGGYAVLLDGKPVKTPARKALLAPNEALADTLVAEWAAQDEIIKPESMPATQIVSTMIDRVSAERPSMSVSVLNYLDTDLLCYRTDHPPELAHRQAQIWGPLLAWFEKKFGVVLETTTDLSALKQAPEAHMAVKNYVESLNDARFTVLQMVTAFSGSLVMGLAFVEQELTADQVFAAAHIEESYKAEIYHEDVYGPDPAQEKKDAAVKIDLAAAERFLNLF